MQGVRGKDDTFAYLLADIGFQVGKLFPGPKYNCDSWACRKITHVCVMTFASFAFSWYELKLVSRMAKEQGTKVPILVKIVQYSMGLAFIVYDVATLNPPGMGTKVLAAFACLAEILLLFSEVRIFCPLAIMPVGTQDEVELSDAQIRKDALAAELRRQIDALDDALGRPRRPWQTRAEKNGLVICES